MGSLIKALVARVKGIFGVKHHVPLPARSREESFLIETYVMSLKDHVPIFKALENMELAALVPFLEERRFPSGAIVFSEGDEGDFIGFVVSGTLTVAKWSQRDRREVLCTISKGAIVGEFSMMVGLPRTATVATMEDSILLTLSRDALDAMIEKHPATGIKIMKIIIHAQALRHNRVADRFLKVAGRLSSSENSGPAASTR